MISRRGARGTRVAVCVMALMTIGGCATEPLRVTPVSVSLYHCGFSPIDDDGRRWKVPEPPFDATNAPPSWSGHGTLTEVDSTHLTYRDESGVDVTFRPEKLAPPVACA